MTVLERPATLTVAISEYIREAIVRGEFAPGSRLPEVALATKLETSRGTIREALRLLANRGLIEVIPRRGVFVSQLSSQATWEITSLRALLEPYAARLALEANASDSAYQAEVATAFGQLREATTTNDPLEVADADIAFHKAVFARCGHDMLLARLETLQVLSRRLVLTNQLIAADAPTLVGQHAPIAAAVKDGDPDELERRVRAHVIEAGELLLGRMSALDRNGGGETQGPASRLGRWPDGRQPRFTPRPAEPEHDPEPRRPRMAKKRSHGGSA